MTDAMRSSANFRLAAMDLAHHLSSLQHYVAAAREFIVRCEQLQSRDVSRHSRKIIALVEISRHTLVRFGVRLYRFAACPTAVAQHKACFFDMLQMVKNTKHLMDLSDHELRGRINRLLLPLSSNLRIATAEDTAASCCPNGSRLLVSPPQSPSCLPTPSRDTSTAPTAVFGQSGLNNMDGKMLPPDVLMSRSSKRRMQRPRLVDPALMAFRPKHMLSQTQASRHVIGNECAAEGSDQPPSPTNVHQSRRRFGIFCTSKPGERRLSGIIR